jgi:hypothetical protein
MDPKNFSNELKFWVKKNLAKILPLLEVFGFIVR